MMTNTASGLRTCGGWLNTVPTEAIRFLLAYSPFAQPHASGDPLRLDHGDPLAVDGTDQDVARGQSGSVCP